MLIPVVEDYYDSGYLPDSGPVAVRGFFPNCNMAVRRSAVASVGGYDEGLPAAEDMDLCRRVSLEGWKLYFEPGAACRHRARPDLAALARQWWGYGVASARVQAKHRGAAVEVYGTLAPVPRLHRFRRWAVLRRFPVRALIFVTPFRVAGVAAVAALAAAVLGAPYAALVLTLLFLIGSWWSVGRGPALGRLRLRHVPGFLLVLVVLDLATLLGGLWGGVRQGMVYWLSVV